MIDGVQRAARPITGWELVRGDAVACHMLTLHAAGAPLDHPLWPVLWRGGSSLSDHKNK